MKNYVELSLQKIHLLNQFFKKKKKQKEKYIELNFNKFSLRILFKLAM